MMMWSFSFLLYVVSGDINSHEYKQGEDVILWYNKIGPYNNPQETYTYHSLPFCHPEGFEKPEQHALGLGEILEGDELYNSGQNINFMVDTQRTELCTQSLSIEDATSFENAITSHYWYQMEMDDLPLWGLVGKRLINDPMVEDEGMDALITAYGENTPIIYTHKRYSISYNGPHIIHVNVSYTEEAAEVKEGGSLSWTYEVQWSETDIPFEDRFDKFLEDDFFENQIHWFSIFNSFMMVIFLCGIVALILLRTLRNDYAKYAQDEDDGEMGFDHGMGDDTGWKHIHGDVFRRPQYLSLYCAVIGTGWQLIMIVTGVIIVAIASSLYAKPGGIISVGIFFYAFSTFISGYVSGSSYYQYFYPNVSPDWILTMILSVSFLPGVVFFGVFCLNWLSIIYGTTYAIPFVTMLKILSLWAFVSFPLAIGGTVLGRHWGGRSNAPCRVNKLARHIPKPEWYLEPRILIMLTGILPFGSIFIEMYFIFTSFWNYKFYYVYGFMLLVFSILIIVTVCVTIVSTYFLLNSENHQWQWISFVASGSTAIYVYLYAIYFFYFKTNMSGVLQTTFYFGYMGLFCLAFFIMCGTIGNTASSIFAKRIYRNIKVE